MQQDYNFSLEGDVVLTAQQGKSGYHKTENEVIITYQKPCEFYRQFVRLLAGIDGKEEACAFPHLGAMADCSRNAVMTVPQAKRFIRLLAVMGYDTLMLYTEETYQIDNEPFFGYMRGAYTKEELKELNDYALILGVELVPCIQTLAHLNALAQWDHYSWHCFDCNDILLVGEEMTYQLIEKMFVRLADCFTTRRVHIGMDEAHMLGSGKYLDKNGYKPRFQIMAEHLTRVIEIAAKYGFTCTMWSDMFFRSQNNGRYDPAQCEMTKEVVDVIPKTVTLTYWDYYRNNYDEYDKMLRAHKKTGNRIAFAGGAWMWNGFAGQNTMSTNRNILAIKACKKHGVDDVLITLWGDDGAEASLLSVLPCLVATAEYAYGHKAVNVPFQAVTGVNYKTFLQLDKLNRVVENPSPFYCSNSAKIFLYNDLLSGIFDFAVKPEFKQILQQNAKDIAKAGKKAGKFAYLFQSAAALASLVADKFDFGVKARAAYQSGDKQTLQQLADLIPTLVKKLDKFYALFQKQWDVENKPWGFQVQDARLGGVRNRMLHCKSIIEEYLAGKMQSIPELEGEILSHHCMNGIDNLQNAFYTWWWYSRIHTACVN